MSLAIRGPVVPRKVSKEIAELSKKINRFVAAPEKRVRGVGAGAEFARVVALPRRPPPDDADPEIQAFAHEASAYLRTREGKQLLRGIQAIALAELDECKGLFAPMRVGAGKTLITYLAAVVLCSRRPLLLIPAKLREKTIRDFSRLREHWQSPAGIYLVNYETLSRDRYGVGEDGEPDAEAFGMLVRYDADLIIADEVQRLKNTGAGCTKNVAQFMDRKPETPFVALSGSITKRSLKDYGHILKWCLKGNAPIPQHLEAFVEWCNALDERVRDENRITPGALLKLATAEDKADGADLQTVARRGFRRRLIETPGVVSYAKPYDGASLLIREVQPSYNDTTEKYFRALRPDLKAGTGWALPDGEPLEDGMIVAAHAREMALGLYYRWDPWPPKPWRITRAAWAAACRHVLRYNGKGINTAGHVMWACTKPTFQGGMWDEARAALKAWKEIELTFKPNQVAVWFDDGPLQLCAEWMRKHKGIVWTKQVAFAERLAKETGRPYFGEQGYARGKFIEDARSKHGSIIASIDANKEGRNLQEEWWENLCTQQPSDGPTNEQYLGRTHRDGQVSDEVNADVLIGCREQVTAWLSALADSSYSEDSTGLPAKILYCDREMPDEIAIVQRARGSARYWTTADEARIGQKSPAPVY